mmetsp:Transcript_1264/g.1929  ORF Transcript_1264/g.1929 Transcript_1264/m.1929 type:complete len:360 (-) Transcript_1264:38-1117(-)
MTIIIDNDNEMVAETRRDLRSLPKAELHLHLEGAMRPSTLRDLCAKYNIVAPTIPTASSQKFTDFSAFVHVYIAACDCLREEEDVYRLVLEVAQDLHKCGVTWAEIAPSFTFYAERFGGMEATLEILVRAAERAQEETNVGIGWVISVERQLGIVPAVELAHLALKGKKLMIGDRSAIVGFGLHGPEEGYPPALFQSAFDIACGEGGLASLPHAGEIAPEINQGSKSVLDAVKLLRAKRIGHGVLAAGDPAVTQVLLDKNVCLDICVTSNYLLNVVSSRESHPLTQFLKEGVKCSISSDDPLLFGCDIVSEFEVCRKDLNMDDSILAECAKTSFEYSCAPDSVKQKGVEGIKEWLSVQE